MGRCAQNEIAARDASALPKLKLNKAKPFEKWYCDIVDRPKVEEQSSVYSIMPV